MTAARIFIRLYLLFVLRGYSYDSRQEFRAVVLLFSIRKLAPSILLWFFFRRLEQPERTVNGFAR